MLTEVVYGGVKIVIDDDKLRPMKTWNGKVDYEFYEREAWNPMPPARLLKLALEWIADRQDLPRSIGHLRESTFEARYRTWRTLPEWPTESTAEVRRAKMHRAFIDPAEAFDPESTGNLLFAGPTGAGKTLAAVHTLLLLWERRIASLKPLPKALFVKHSAIANARRSSPLGEEPQIIQDAMKAELLLIDDIGQGDERDTALFEIVDARYDAGKATIATTGLDSAQFAARIGETVQRRLLQAVRPGKLVSTFPKAALTAVAGGAR
jgi:DNA replication protein DnaC